MSQMRVIQNEFLRVAINDMGAELSSAFDKVADRETIWDGNEQYWIRRAPILFPWVGRANEGKYQYNNESYEMTAHGFARDMEFEVVEYNETKVTHRITSTAVTKEIYPFDFTLTIAHTLVGRELLIEWNVNNDGNREMYFSIGAHPGFQVPALPNTKQTDYYLKFDESESLNYILIDEKTGGAITSEVYQLNLSQGVCPITEKMWDKDAYIFENNQVKEISILNPNQSPYITVKSPDFPYMGVWSKPGAPFICLEPWIGRTDDYGFKGDISEKSGIYRLEENGEFHIGYTIEFHG